MHLEDEFSKVEGGAVDPDLHPDAVREEDAVLPGEERPRGAAASARGVPGRRDARERLSTDRRTCAEFGVVHIGEHARVFVPRGAVVVTHVEVHVVHVGRPGRGLDGDDVQGVDGDVADTADAVRGVGGNRLGRVVDEEGLAPHEGLAQAELLGEPLARRRAEGGVGDLHVQPDVERDRVGGKVRNGARRGVGGGAADVPHRDYDGGCGSRRVGDGDGASAARRVGGRVVE